MIKNFSFYDCGLYIGSDCLSINCNNDIQDTYVINNNYIYKISGLECKIPILKYLHSIKI